MLKHVGAALLLLWIIWMGYTFLCAIAGSAGANMLLLVFVGYPLLCEIIKAICRKFIPSPWWIQWMRDRASKD
jgi:hypothetical protein